MEKESEKVRVDKYLWAIRIFKTRNIAKEFCESGRVKFNDKSIKPAHIVSLNDIYTINLPARLWKIKVTGLVAKRGDYSTAVQFYEDLTPPAEINKKQEKQTASFYTGKRLSKTGKPSKKERRNLEEFLGS